MTHYRYISSWKVKFDKQKEFITRDSMDVGAKQKE
jgi:hypothetical protein